MSSRRMELRLSSTTEYHLVREALKVRFKQAEAADKLDDQMILLNLIAKLNALKK